MLRGFVLALTVLSVGAWGILTIGCGSSKKSTSCIGGPYNVVGNWQVTVTANGGNPLTGYGAIDSSGLALFFDNSTSTGNSGDTLKMPTITGTCSFSGNITDYEEPGGLSSGQSVTDTAQGTLSSATAMNGTFTGSGGNGTFSGATFSPLAGSVSVVSGSKTGQVAGTLNGQAVLLPLSFSPTGTGASMSFTSSSTVNNACTVTGTFNQVGSANVFDVSITFTGTGNGGAGCALSGSFSGIGFESNTDYFGFNANNPADTYLYADIQASSNTFVMEIF